MRRPRKIVVGMALLAAAMAAGVWVYVEYISWPDPPPHLVGRLPPASALPPNLTHAQRQAIRLLYSWYSDDRGDGIVKMDETGVPPEVQAPYLIALLADKPWTGEEPRPSAIEKWVRNLLDRPRPVVDVEHTSLDRPALRRAAAVPAIVKAIKEDPDTNVRRLLMHVLGENEAVTGPARDEAVNGTPQPTWRPDPRIMDALIDILKSHPDEEVRDAAVMYYFVADRNAELLADNVRGDDAVAQPSEAGTRICPEHREAILAAFDHDPSAKVRIGGFFAVAHFMPDELIAHLVKMFDDPDENFRNMALQFLLHGYGPGPGAMFSPDDRRPVVEAFIAALRHWPAKTDDPKQYHERIVGCLKDLTNQDFGDDADKWQAWYDAHQDDFRPP